MTELFLFNRRSITKIFLMMIFSCVGLIAQVSNYISNVQVSDAKENRAITISAELFAVENISEITLAYKSFGTAEFKKRDMIITGAVSSGTIPGESVLPPYLEYYLIIRLKDGSSQTFPLGVDQGIVPLQISVAGSSLKDKEIFILSPFEGESLSEDEMLISISFIKAPDYIDIHKTKIYLNEEDVSFSALVTVDLIVLSGENLPKTFATETRRLRVEVFDKEGNLYHSIQRTFNVVTAQLAKMIESSWKYNGYLKGESRGENFNKASTWYNNFSAELNSSYHDWKLNGYAYLTSEEKNDLQPYNRYSFSLQGGDWFGLKIGDSYPRFPSLIMDGKRIRGFSGFLNLGAVNLQTSFGETERKIEGKLLEKFLASQVPLSSDIIAINKTKYGFPFGRVDFGTYSRKIFTVRPSFGRGENFQFGLTYQHSKDDTKSIEFGALPQENIVFGSDLMLALDNQNFMFTSQIAFSLLNKDIATGNLTDAQIDSLFGPNSTFDLDPADVKRVRDLIGKFITVNQYLGPWNPQEFASLAGEAALTLNYLNNNFRVSYIYRGSEYNSFGQTFLRTDVKGINIVDRIRMFDNKLFLSVGYEQLEDNLQKTKIAVTTFQTISGSVSFFPRMDFPNITIGFNRFKNNNGLKLSDQKNGKFTIDDVTNRILLQMSYDFTAGIKHNASISYTNSIREDNGFANSDASFSSGSFNVSSSWNNQLISIFGLVYSSSEIKNIPFNYFSLSLGGRYRLLENKLQLSASFNPSFGDFKRQSFELIADYNLFSNVNLSFQTRVFRIPGSATNSIVGLSTRLSI